MYSAAAEIFTLCKLLAFLRAVFHFLYATVKSGKFQRKEEHPWVNLHPKSKRHEIKI